MPPRRRLVATLLGCALALRAPVSGAQPAREKRPPQVDDAPLPVLTVVRSPGAQDCPDSAALAEAVARQAGHTPALEPAAAAPSRLEPAAAAPGTLEQAAAEGGRVAAAPGFDVEIRKLRLGYVATIRPRGQRSAERRLSDPGSTCAGVAAAVALTLAILLDRDVSTPPARTAEGPGRGPRRPPPQAIGPDRRLEAPPPWPRKRGLGLDVHGWALGAVSILDGLGLAVASEVAVPLPSGLRLVGGVIALPTQSRDAPPGRIDLSLVAMTLRLGTTVLRRPLGDGTIELSASAVAAAGALRAEGVGFADAPPPRHDPWIAAGPCLGAEGSLLGPLGWSVRADTVILLRRQRYIVARRAAESGADRGATPGSFETPPVGFVFGAGLRLTIL